jgi:hypothetical protein
MFHFLTALAAYRQGNFRVFRRRPSNLKPDYAGCQVKDTVLSLLLFMSESAQKVLLMGRAGAGSKDFTRSE